MNGAMVRATLEGRKTVTRRIMKPQPKFTRDFLGDGLVFKHELRSGVHRMLGLKNYVELFSPYGQPGDRLWVRETTVNVEEHGYLGPVFAASDEGSAIRDWGLAPDPDDCTDIEPEDIKLRPSIYTPKAWARLWLEVTGVRVERLLDISEEQAHREGVDNHMCAKAVYESPYKCGPATIMGFAHLWEQINGSGSWDTNPWVWVVEFKRVEVAHG